MKILKRGQRDKYIFYKEYRHYCFHCGCKFSFLIEECEQEGKGFSLILNVHCPQCGWTNRLHEDIFDYKIKKKKKKKEN